MATKVIPAELRRLNDAISFVEGELEKLDCSAKDRAAIDVALEEIFVNVAHYAYPGCEGAAIIDVNAVDGGVRIDISDEGKPFNPLAKKDPDITLSSDERNIGGLGIYMVKKMMDEVSYDYAYGKNILTMIKYLAK